MSDLKNKILKDGFKHVSSNYISLFLTSLMGIVIRKILGPSSMGIFSLVMLFLDYAAFSYMGIHKAVSLEIPYYTGKGDFIRVRKIKEILITFSILSSLIICAGVLVWMLVCRQTIAKDLFFAGIAGCVIFTLRRVYNAYIMLVRSRDDFHFASLAVLVDTIANTVLTFVFIIKFNIYGLFYAMMLTYAINVFFVVKWSKEPFVWGFDFKVFWGLFKYGFPLMVIGFASEILSSIDRLMITKFLGIEALGVYSVATMCMNYLNGVSQHFNVVLLPKVLGEYGKRNSVDDIKKFVTHTAKVWTLIMPIFLAGTFFFIDPLVFYVLPKYSSGVAASKILVFCTFFIALNIYADHFIASLKKQVAAFFLNIIALSVNVGANYYFIKIGWGIAGVALGTVLSTFVSFTLIYIYVLRHFNDFKNIARFLFYVYSVFGLHLACILSLGSITAFYFSNLWVRASAGFFGFCVVDILLVGVVSKYNKDVDGVIAFVRSKCNMDRFLRK